MWFTMFKDVPKVHRFTLGGKIERYFLELLEYILIALYLPPEQKISHLTLAIAKLDGVKFFLQLAWENKCVAHARYAELSAHLDEVGRMLGGWRKGLQKKTLANHSSERNS